MRYVFITGTSRGLGNALLEMFEEDRVISISRSKVETEYPLYKEFYIDFLDEKKLERSIEEIFESIEAEPGDDIFFINNAGVVDPVKSVSNLEAEELLNNYKVNVLAPALFMKGFVNKFKDHQGAKRILTVSSGAALNPTEGWAAYCSSKAAVNMVSDVLRLEMDRLKYPIFSATFRPGVIDTDMQSDIRASEAEQFPDVERFKKFKDTNKLYNKKTVAYVLKRVITSDNFAFSESFSISDFL